MVFLHYFNLFIEIKNVIFFKKDAYTFVRLNIKFKRDVQPYFFVLLYSIMKKVLNEYQNLFSSTFNEVKKIV